ncbi:MAG: conserved membrane protein of unknown function [Candidatus Thorarchaeota archaeon]|nr:MAG: conserved membrane protein of unknown function [Candidatus Thorarchaeota archaeon]
MEKIKEPYIRDLLILHGLFAIFTIVALILPLGVQIGPRLFVLVIAYNLMIPIGGYYWGHRDWIALWSFSFLVSLFMIFPDWFLAAELGVLVFPADGLFKIGPVSGYMAGLWTIPIFIIVFIGREIQKNHSYMKSYLVVAILSLVIFFTAEATMWMLPSWYAQNVAMIGPVAIYIIIPEIILGITAHVAYDIIIERSVFAYILAAFSVMIIYMGTISFFHLLIEKIILGV